MDLESRSHWLHVIAAVLGVSILACGGSNETDAATGVNSGPAETTAPDGDFFDPALAALTREAGFIPFLLPSGGWQPGTIVDIGTHGPNAPQIQATPTAAGIRTESASKPMANMQRGSEFSYDVTVGAGLNQIFGGELSAKGARSYSFTLEGAHALETEPTHLASAAIPLVLARFEYSLAPLLLGGQLHAVQSLFCANGLDYSFFDKDGGRLDLRGVIKIPVRLAPELSWTRDGALSYASDQDALCFGYKDLPLRREATGDLFIGDLRGAKTDLAIHVALRSFGARNPRGHAIPDSNTFALDASYRLIGNDGTELRAATDVGNLGSLRGDNNNPNARPERIGPGFAIPVPDELRRDLAAVDIKFQVTHPANAVARTAHLSTRWDWQPQQPHIDFTGLDGANFVAHIDYAIRVENSIAAGAD